MENENKTTHTVLRVLVVGGIIAILIFLSIGIVRVIPRAVNALASASVSIGSIFKSSVTGTTTPASNGSNGFYVTGTTTANAPYVAHTEVTSTASTTETNKTPYSPTPYSATPTHNVVSNGPSDIAVTIISRGVRDQATGQYIETNTFTTSDTVVVKFKIENRGTGPTGVWNLHVSMPSTNVADQTRTVNGNRSLTGGSSVIGQAVFDSPAYGSNSAVNITVEQTQKTDTDPSNNNATSILSVSGNNGGNINYPGNTGTQADLSGTIMQLGILDNANNFVPTTSFHSYDRVAVQFKVVNTGSTASGPWSFRIEMTGNPLKTYTSNEQSVPGNSTLTYIVGVSNPQIGYNNINIILDSGNNVSESNEGNNVLSTNFNVSN